MLLDESFWKYESPYYYIIKVRANQNKNNCLVSNFYNKFSTILRAKQVGFQVVVEIAHKAVALILISL